MSVDLDLAMKRFTEELIVWLAKGGDARLKEFDPLSAWDAVVALLAKRERMN